MADPYQSAARTINAYCAQILDWAVRKQFRNAKEPAGGPTSLAVEAMLVVTEMAELVEAHRCGKDKSPDEHCPEFTKAEIECADAVIRLFDMAGAREWRLGQAIDAKMAFNENRPIKHGKRY